MPIVPRLNNPTVDQKPISGVKSPTDVSVDAFGGGASTERVGQAGRALAQTGLNIYEAEMHKADQIATRDTELAAAEINNEIEAGIRSMKGKDAGNVPDYINEQWRKGTEKLALTFKNDNQRAAGQDILRVRRMQLDETANIHMANEFKHYNDQQHVVAMESKRNEGSMKYNRPGAIVNSIFEQEKEIDRYVETTPGLSKEWADLEKVKARSATIRDVLTRAMIDDDKLGIGGDPSMTAKKYEKAVSKYLTPDDVDILDKVRKEAKINKAESEEYYRRSLYRTVTDSDASTREKLDFLRGEFDKNKMDLVFYKQMRDDILKVYNPEIPQEEIVAKHIEILDALRKLDSVETVDPVSGKKYDVAKGNSYKDLKPVYDLIMASGEYMKPAEQKKYISFIQQDVTASQVAKKNMFRSVLDSITAASIPALVKMDLIRKGFGLFDEGVTIEQAGKKAQEFKTEAVTAGNPLRTKYTKGQVLSAGSQVELNGKKYVLPGTVTVVGYDDDGTPILDEGIVKVKPDGN